VSKVTPEQVVKALDKDPDLRTGVLRLLSERLGFPPPTMPLDFYPLHTLTWEGLVPRFFSMTKFHCIDKIAVGNTERAKYLVTLKAQADFPFELRLDDGAGNEFTMTPSPGHSVNQPFLMILEPNSVLRLHIRSLNGAATALSELSLTAEEKR